MQPEMWVHSRINNKNLPMTTPPSERLISAIPREKNPSKHKKDIAPRPNAVPRQATMPFATIPKSKNMVGYDFLTRWRDGCGIGGEAILVMGFGSGDA
eukprot:3240545-Amphidinium_carterae.2